MMGVHCSMFTEGSTKGLKVAAAAASRDRGPASPRKPSPQPQFAGHSTAIQASARAISITSRSQRALAQTSGGTSYTAVESSMSMTVKAAVRTSKIYKEASAFYLTRRLAEALTTIQPLVTPVPLEDADDETDADSNQAAPITHASRRSRIKVWCFYLTLLNAICELGPEDGEEAFGGREWRILTAKARDGSIWDEVVTAGYEGVEARVDAEVVSNL